MNQTPFWKTKSLAELSKQEWESLCDSCGKCCLHKLEDEASGEVFYTSVVCDLINLDNCRCTRYADRCNLVPNCLNLRQHAFTKFNWLPATCAYKLLAEGEELPSWHPLVTGNNTAMHNAGVSIRSYAMKESTVEHIEQHIIKWQK